MLNMKKAWICAFAVAFIGACATAQEQDSPDEPEEYDDYYNFDNFSDLLKKLDEEITNINEKTDSENDLKVENEIKKFIEGDEINNSIFDKSKHDIDNSDDYQIEDNRNKEKKDDDLDMDENVKNEYKLEESEKDTVSNDAGNRPEPDDVSARNGKDDYALLWGDDNVAPLPVPEVPKEDENKAILDETQKILNEKDADNFEDEIKKAIEELVIKNDDQPMMEQIIDETNQLLAESGDDAFDENFHKDVSQTTDKNNDTTTKKQNFNRDVFENKDASEEDTADKVYADLNADLDKLFETLDKLREDSSSSEVEDKDKAMEEANNFFQDNYSEESSKEGFEELVEDKKDDNPVDLDKLLQDILDEVDMKAENTAAEDLTPIVNDGLNEPNPDDAIEKDVETVDSKLEPILYINDELVDNSIKNAESVENNDETGDINASVEKQEETKIALVDNLSSAELDDLVSQFSMLHSEDLDVHSNTFQKSITPERITLKVDEPTIITSPNYPNPYPTNNIVDYIVEGLGEGIELNITEFAVNGALGDYLLIKPGGVDDSGHDGILFTYRLRTERRYRFTDVDRLFMRFETKLGMQFYRGFVISAKMIAPVSEGPEPIPEPEAVVDPPHSTATLTLAVSMPYFRDVKEDFRLILADMADEYIKDNDLDPGFNSTSEVTQITNVGLCPMSWPGYERCVAVTFGIALVYEEEGDPRLNTQDLHDMWNTYASKETFASRLDRLAINEFYPPDGSAMTAWLVIAAGVVISMIMLALVLWRFSCFEDYTRMKTFSDTDSVHEKRTLDLYPTPHQHLPPLYAESEYKWQEEDSTRVDMGGFANRSYARDNMYDFDSDEEVVAPHDRNGATTRDISHV